MLFIQCSNNEDSLIAKNRIGKITKSTKVTDLEVVFKNDSIAKLPENAEIFREYKIYDQEENHLLTIKLNNESDSIQTIGSVQIYDKAYVTEKGISTTSLYKDIVDNYSINKVEPTFTSAMLFIDEINITIALNKSDLKLDEFDMRDINPDQIPDNAKINFITVWFD